jgi:WD40 repeat protein
MRSGNTNVLRLVNGLLDSELRRARASLQRDASGQSGSRPKHLHRNLARARKILHSAERSSPSAGNGRHEADGAHDDAAPARFDYDAFISYRRVDGTRVAEWLRNAIQRYRLPTELGRGRAALRCYLDTAYSRATDDFWDQNIAPALARSRCLILVATKACLAPRPDGSPNWVHRELETFGISGGRAIYVARGDGELSDPIPEGFPERTHHVDLRAAASPVHRLRFQTTLSDELLSLVAPLYEVAPEDMPLLRQEERRRATLRRRSRFLFAAIVGGALLAAFGYARRAAKVAEYEGLQADAARASEYARQPGRGDDALSLAVRTYAKAIDIPEVAEGTSLGLAASLTIPVSIPLVGHTAEVMAAAVSRDGKYAITSDRSGVAIVWNTADGKAHSKLQGHEEGVAGAQFVSLPGGKQGVVTADAQGTLHAWSVDGTMLQTLSAPCRLRKIEANDFAQRLLGICEDGTLHEWPLSDHPSLGASTSYPVDGVVDAHYSGNGQFAIVGTLDGRVSLWTTSGHEGVAHWLAPGVSVVAVTRDAANASCGTTDGAIYFFQRGPAAASMVRSAHGAPVRFLKYAPDESSVVTADERIAKRWEVGSHEASWVDSLHGSTILAVDISPDGRLVVTSGRDNVYVTDAYSDHLVTALSGHAGLCYDAVFTPDSRHVITVNGDHSARMWTLPAPLAAVDFVGHGDEVNSAQFALDGQRVVTGSDDSTAMIWEASTGRRLRTLRRNDQAVNGAAFSFDGSKIVAASQDGCATVYDASSGRTIETFAHGAAVNWATFDGSGRYLATAGEDGRTLLWNIATEEKIELEFQRYHPMQFVEYSPTGGLLVTAGDDQRARIWDANSHKLLRTLVGHDGSIMSASFSRDATRIVTASLDGTARVWSTGEDGKALQVIRVGGDGVRVMSAAFSPDATRIATAGADGRVEIWDATTGSPLLVLQAGGKAVQRVQFSPAGDHVLISSNGGSARLYPSTGPGLLSLACARAHGLPDWATLRSSCQAALVR